MRPEAQSHEATWTGGQSQESSGLNPCSYCWDHGPKKGQRRWGRRTDCNNLRTWLKSHQPPNIPQDSASHVPKPDFSRGGSLLSSSPSCPSFLPKCLSFGNREFCFSSGMLREPGTLISLSNILASVWNATYVTEQTQYKHAVSPRGQGTERLAPLLGSSGDVIEIPWGCPGGWAMWWHRESFKGETFGSPGTRG